MRVGDYELLEEIGRGGGGRVHRARAPDGREVAVKVLGPLGDPVGGPPGGGATARFLREQRLQGQFGLGEGFVPLLDAGEEAGAAYLVLPLLPGGSLRQRLARGPLGLEEARGLGIALGRALAAAHARGVVHRDLKPGNVLFDGAGRPLLADLGLARHFTDQAPDRVASVGSQAGELRGTPGYMAPEQMFDARGVGPPADVFALGVVLYEALSGRVPFAGAGLVETVQQMERGAFAPLQVWDPDLPDGLARLIGRMLAWRPEERPSAPEVVAALEGVGGAPAGAGHGAGRSAGRSAAGWLSRGLVGVGGLALALGAGALLRARGPVASQVPPPVAAATPAPGSARAPAEQVLGDTTGLLPLPPTCVAALSEREVALLGVSGEVPGLDLGGVWIVDLQGEVRLRLDHPGARVLDVGLDGRRVGTLGPGEVRIWDSADGRLLTTLRPAEREPHGLALALHDALALTVTTRDGTARGGRQVLEVWDLDGGRRLQQLEGLRDRRLAALALDARRTVVVGSAGQVVVWDTSSGEVLESFQLHQPREAGAGARAARVAAAIDLEAGLVVGETHPGSAPLAPEPDPGELRWVALGSGGEPARRERVSDAADALALLPFGGPLVRVEPGGELVALFATGERRAIGRAEPHPLRPALAVWPGQLFVCGRRVRAVGLGADGVEAPLRAVEALARGNGAHGNAVQDLIVAPGGPGGSGGGGRLRSVDACELLEWDLDSGRLLARRSLRDRHERGPVRFAGPDRVLVGGARALEVWERQGQTWSRRLVSDDPLESLRTGLAVSEDGAVLLERTLATVRQVHLADGRVAATWGGGLTAISELRLSSDGARALLVRPDGQGELWDPGAGRRLASGRLPGCQTAALRWLPAEGRAEAVCGQADGVRLVALGSAEGARLWAGQDVRVVAASPAGTWVGAASLSGQVAVWRGGEAAPRREWSLVPASRPEAARDVATALRFLPDERTLLVGTAQGRVLRFGLDP